MRPYRIAKLVKMSANFQRVLLRDRGHDAVEAQIDNELSIVIGKVPKSRSGYAEFGVRPGVTAFDAVVGVRRSDGGKDFVAVVEGVLKILE